MEVTCSSSSSPSICFRSCFKLLSETRPQFVVTECWGLTIDDNWSFISNLLVLCWLRISNRFSNFLIYSSSFFWVMWSKSSFFSIRFSFFSNHSLFFSNHSSVFSNNCLLASKCLSFTVWLILSISWISLSTF